MSPSGRPIVLPFRIPRSGELRIEVVQVSPACRQVGVARISGRPGSAARFRGRGLAPGTYVLRAVEKRVRVVVVREGRPHNLLEQLAADRCAAIERHPFTAAVSANASGAAAAQPSRDEGAAPVVTGEERPYGVLGAGVTKIREAAEALHPATFVLLAVAIALLGAASVPAAVVPHAGAAAVLAQRRIELTLAGVAALAAAVAAAVLQLAQ